jgi:hypothetical protein
MENLKLSIDSESVNIYIDNGDDQEPTHLLYWHLDEVIEDPELAFVIANAIHTFYTDPEYIYALRS